MQPTLAAIALGSNMGDRHAHIREAMLELSWLPVTTAIAYSGLFETEPVGPVPQGSYINAAALVRTLLTPRALLAGLHEIEFKHGRRRDAEQRWGPRTLDLDLLLYADLVLTEPELCVPHPRMLERSFVLEPLSEIGSDLRVPPTGITVGDAWSKLKLSI
jgi:2-amino-4-hydroxy-6-hydroxymethyldihydropteridine diphosphokinase